MNQNLLSQLEELNLSSNEASVYLALLETGQTSAGDLIRKTKFHRSVVYETLDKLIDKKLVLKLIKNNVWHFQASDPERLLQKIKVQEEIAHSLIPNLKELISQKLPEITVYEGLKSYQRFWLESIQKMPEGATDYIAGSIGGQWIDTLAPINRQYFRIAKKRKINWKMIVFDLDDLEQSYLKKHPGFKYECRLVDKKVSKEGNFNIFGDDILVLHSATEPMIIEVKNQSLVKVFRNLFDILWDTGKVIKT